MIKSRKMELIAYIVIGAIAISIILPFLLLFMSSFTDEMSITRNGYSFLQRTSVWVHMNIYGRVHLPYPGHIWFPLL